MNTKTMTIAGKEISLEIGKRYAAGRPFAQRGINKFPVTISEITPSGRFFRIYEIGSMSYAQANKFLTKFNNGTYGFEGRTWK